VRHIVPDPGWLAPKHSLLKKLGDVAITRKKRIKRHRLPNQPFSKALITEPMLRVAHPKNLFSKLLVI